jgi:hypothetical protein
VIGRQSRAMILGENGHSQTTKKRTWLTVGGCFALACSAASESGSNPETPIERARPTSRACSIATQASHDAAEEGRI